MQLDITGTEHSFLIKIVRATLIVFFFLEKTHPAETHEEHHGRGLYSHVMWFYTTAVSCLPICLLRMSRTSQVEAGPLEQKLAKAMDSIQRRERHLRMPEQRQRHRYHEKGYNKVWELYRKRGGDNNARWRHERTQRSSLPYVVISSSIPPPHSPPVGGGARRCRKKAEK